ncbi:MAG: magnesium chelatase subunit H [Steroidobacteraceae bacterium]
MRQKRTSAAESPVIRVVLITLDSHMASAAERAQHQLLRSMPGLRLALHAAAEWEDEAGALERCLDDIAAADIIVVNMMFLEDHIRAVLPALEARRGNCDAIVACMSAAEVVRLTRLGRFDMSSSQGGPLALLKKLRGNRERSATVGEQQLRMLKRIPKILRFVPGPAQDVRAYFLTMQYLFAGSDDNLVSLVKFLVDRYAGGARASLKGTLKAEAPADYPSTGLYHPRLKGRITENPAALPGPPGECRGTVGLLVMRSYLLAGNTAHYDAVIAALEARGLKVITSFATGLDARPAVERYFMRDGRSAIDAMLSLTGFSLVGGPAYNDSGAAEEMLAQLDVPCLSAMAVEFQSLEQWQSSQRGLMPVESTIMVAIPELDGSTGAMVFGGRNPDASSSRGRDMMPDPERVEALADRMAKLVALRRSERAQRKVGIVLFNFPPNAGSAGTAAHLGVFASLLNLLRTMADEGYSVDVPEDEATLKAAILGGNSAKFGTTANVHHRIPASDHVRRERWLEEIEAQWGPAPGKQQSDGSSLLVLGERFGNVFVGLQPAFGYEGDPMQLLFDGNFAPTHAFSAFYRYLREDFGANVLLHFGTHGALEFMPGKQVGLSGRCWPDRLIGDLPNVYLYACNNPSEGAIARRRSLATLVSYLTPSVTEAGLYRGLLELKDTLEHWRTLEPDREAERSEAARLIQAQAVTLDLLDTTAEWDATSGDAIEALRLRVLELEHTLIPCGLHVLGEAPAANERTDILLAMAADDDGEPLSRESVEALVAGKAPDAEDPRLLKLAEVDRRLAGNAELPALIRALDGRYIRPAPGGDLLHNQEVLPTGRNIHGFDPFRMPTQFAVREGMRQVEKLLRRNLDDGHAAPESVAMVLWGTDNLKSGGGPIAQALALLGTRPRFDTYGRLAGAELIPLEELGRPRIDVVITLSGIFRDLLPLQIRMLAEACLLAAAADEPPELNFVRRHALAYQQETGCDLETAALRVFSNADSTYGSNVNHLVDSGLWNHEEELAETYTRRKSFAYGCKGRPTQQADLLKSVLGQVDLAYQNLDSVELGVTTVDHYFDTLGGISRAVQRASGETVPVYIGDQTRGDGQVRSLSEQVAIETRTRMLNPRWYEGMLKHGFEGVRQIEQHVTNMLGWSATTGQVAPWVYQQLTQTYVLDDEMRERLAALNPTASARVANRLIEAHERSYWTPDEATLAALRRAGEELEDRLEGVGAEAAA